jgi:predicted kinase
MPNFYMLIGVPAAGKSTWRAQYAGNAEIISTDDIIDHRAAKLGVTYNDVFKDTIKDATELAKKHAYKAFLLGQDVVWDQTNLTKKNRASKLAMVPKNYKKIAVFFPTPYPDIHKKRLDRPGKSIPDYVMSSMIKTVEPPSKDEGFDEIITA